jgi:hypothetical protein
MKFHTKSNNSNSLTSYLTTAVTVGTLASTSHATVLSLDLSSISGPNAGVVIGTYSYVDFSTIDAGLTGPLGFVNDYIGLWGFGITSIPIAVNGGYATPRNFSPASWIDASASFSADPLEIAFRVVNANPVVSPDFGPASYIGFLSDNGHYGYLEVTWEATTNTFQILSGAYEDQPGVGIMTPVPEPSSAMLSLGALAAGACIRRRKQAA